MTLPAPLTDCRRVFLRDFELRIHIGVHGFEQDAPQRVLFNVDLYVSLAHSTPVADELAEVVDYDFIRRTITERAARGHVRLQETLCDDVAAVLLQHPHVRAVRVSTEKPDVYPDCATIGIEVFHIKSPPDR